jgi:predicted RNA-binding protein with PIN domain
VSELIVDGYNIIHAWPELAPLIKRGHAEEARRRLVAMLAEYAASSGDRVTVVFDAHARARDHGAGEVVDGVTVLFGSANNSADHVIERRVSEASRAGDSARVTVATSDRLQRDMVMAMGAAVVGAESLHAMVQAVRAETADHSARRRREAGFAGRLDNALDATTRQRLERLRRGQTEDLRVHDGDPAPADT